MNKQKDHAQLYLLVMMLLAPTFLIVIYLLK